MPVLKDLKKRINTVKATKKITKAMKMVAASKLRKTNTLLENSKPYHQEIEKALIELIDFNKLPKNSSLLMMGKKNVPKHLYLIAGSEKGLCGGFNGNIVKLLNKRISLSEQDYFIICLSGKIYSMLKGRYGNNIIEVTESLFSKNIEYKDIRNIFEKVINYFNNNEIGSCSLIYNKFNSVISQVVTEKSLIPYTLAQTIERDSGITAFESEPDIELILEALLKKAIEGEIYYSILENAVSEHGARMNAMDNATRNADKMIKDLTLQYNRSRQANITKELIEIISGSEAL